MPIVNGVAQFSLAITALVDASDNSVVLTLTDNAGVLTPCSVTVTVSPPLTLPPTPINNF